MAEAVLVTPQPFLESGMTNSYLTQLSGDRGVSNCGQLLEGMVLDPSSKEAIVDKDKVIKEQKKLINTLHKEKKRTEQKLKEVLESNKKWESYDQSRDELVNKLESEKRELQAKLSQVRPSDVHTNERDDIILYWKRKSDEEEAIRKRVEQENRTQQLYICSLEHALHRASAVDQEQIELLKNQVKIFQEDFEQERRDRERSQAKLHDLEEELKLCKVQLDQYQSSTMAHLAMKRQQARNSFMEEYNRQVEDIDHNGRYDATHSRLIPHGANYHYDIEEDISGDEDDVNSKMSSSFYYSNQRENQRENERPQPSNSLQCPKCNELFDSSDPLTFLEHTDECQ